MFISLDINTTQMGIVSLRSVKQHNGGSQPYSFPQPASYDILLYVDSPRTPLLSGPKPNPQSLHNHSFTLFPSLTPMLKVNNLATSRALPHPARIKLPPARFLRIPPQVPLKGCVAGPAEHGATNCSPGGDDNVDAAVGVVILCSLIGWLIWVRVLPHDECFIERVEVVFPIAVAAVGQGLLATI